MKAIALLFELQGQFESAERFGSGHINDSYLVGTNVAGQARHYVLQRINRNVFPDPVKLMENVARVTDHLRSKESDRCLTLVSSAVSGSTSHVIDDETWRMYEYLDGTKSYDRVPSIDFARQAAFAFGQFQAFLADLPGDRLHETIADFHHTPKRFAALHHAWHTDTCGRAHQCVEDYALALTWEPIADRLTSLAASGAIPERVTHNDTKLNNVMFDEESGDAVCVVDLDTVMPGLSLYDFGDMVRTTATSAAEDETDLSRVSLRLDYYKALAEGYLAAAGSFLNRTEIEHLAFSGLLLTVETGVRFLTDYLSGDTYFRINHDGQNLQRCRAQFALATDLESNMSAMEEVTQVTAKTLKP